MSTMSRDERPGRGRLPARLRPARAGPPALRGATPVSASDRYSRRVALLKRALPAIGILLLLFVAIWPRLGPLLDRVRRGISAIDLREAGELRMVSPRYAGIDRLGRPFVMTAASGRQLPDKTDLMSLEQPHADIQMHSGSIVTVTAASGIYQSQTQLLDLFDHVHLTHQNGTSFISNSAHLDLSKSTGEGHDPVEGHGPQGDIDAQGFRITDKGDTILFTGKSHLLLNGSKPGSHEPVPPSVPLDVARSAAQAEAAGLASEKPTATAPTPAIATRTPAAPKPPAAMKKMDHRRPDRQTDRQKPQLQKRAAHQSLHSPVTAASGSRRR